MYKNILIIGAARTGKTTLARKIQKEFGYNLVSLDDIICALEEYPECHIKHDGDENETAKNFSPFLKRYMIELSEGTNFYNGVKSVIEGTHIDFEELMPFLKDEKVRDKYIVIGLTYNSIDEQTLYNEIKKNDTEDDWTYWCDDEELKGNVKYFIERNKYFNKKFKEYDIITFDTSINRKQVLADAVQSLKELGK